MSVLSDNLPNNLDAIRIETTVTPSLRPRLHDHLEHVGRALWSDGGPSRAFQFFEVKDERVPGLVCSGYRPT